MKWLIRRDGEAILGMATIGSHIDPNFSVCVNPDAHRVGECYFKYCDRESYARSERIVRLDIRSPRVIVHRNRDGKSKWVLNSHEKRNICNYLRERNQTYGDSCGATNWDYVLFAWNNEMGLLYPQPKEQYSSMIEAFLDGWYDTDENLNNPSYVASDLPIPDYTQIPQGK